MKILFVSPFLPWPKNIGIALRINSILIALQLIGNVDCVFFGDEHNIKKIPTGVIPSVIKVLQFPDLIKHPLLGPLFKLIPPENREWWFYYLPGFHLFYPSSKEIIEQFSTIDITQYDLIFFVRIPTLWWLRWKSTIPTIVDVDDVMHLGIIKSNQSDNKYIKKIIKKWHYLNVKFAEMGILSSVSASFVCSKDDANILSKKNINILPNIFPDRGQLKRDLSVTNSPIILFIGALVYKPNREALDFFIKKVFPLIRKKCPRAILRIVGKTAVDQSFSWSNDDGIEFLGTVENIDPIIESAAIEVCPILYGLGTRIKILEALSFGKCVVSTSVGAHGIDLYENSGLFRADTPEKLADICISLLNDLALRQYLAPFAREGVSKYYSQDRVNSIISKVVQEVIEHQKQ